MEAKRRNIWVSLAWLGGATCVGLAGMLVAAFAAGGGHGTYLPAKVLFPFTMVSTVWTGGRITPFAIALAFLQFPVYGVILDLTKFRRRSMVPLGAAHCLALAASVLFARNFPEIPS